MITVDQRVRFDAFQDVGNPAEKISNIVTGTVYEVNYAHKVFHVAYLIGGLEMHTSFKFCDIGTKVRVV